jgi:hypothetical protein
MHHVSCMCYPRAANYVKILTWYSWRKHVRVYSVRLLKFPRYSVAVLFTLLLRRADAHVKNMKQTRKTLTCRFTVFWWKYTRPTKEVSVTLILPCVKLNVLQTSKGRENFACQFVLGESQMFVTLHTCLVR